MKAETRAVIAELRAVADPSRLPGMARVGINVDRALGVSIPELRKIGRRHRPDHALALDLWRSGIHEARILASMVDDPAKVTRDQMEEWVGDFDSWDLCDQVDLEPLRPDTVRDFRRSRVDEAARGVREACGVRDDRGAHRPRPDGARSHVRRLVPGDPPRCDGRSQLREEGRELGAPADRQAEPGAQRGGHRGGGVVDDIRCPQRALGRSRCAPRAPERTRPSGDCDRAS